VGEGAAAFGAGDGLGVVGEEAGAPVAVAAGIAPAACCARAGPWAQGFASSSKPAMSAIPVRVFL
jgi:hypothetical protein